MSLSERNDVIKRISSISEMFFQGNTSALAREIGVKQSTLRDIISGKVKPSYDTITKFVENPTLNISSEWLLTGEGDMLKQPSEEENNNELDGIEGKFIPLLPVSAQGGRLNDFVVSVRESDCEKVVSPIKDADFAIPVSGDSMAPEYPNGSQVHVKKINENAFIEWGRVYVLDTCNGAVIKRIVPSEREGYVRCISINPAPIYAPFEIDLNDIYGIYRVMLCLSIK